MFGDNLKKARIAAGISQTKLARELHVTQGAISQWENGLTKPDTELLPLIADLLHISIDELMDRDGAIDDDTLALRERLRRDPDMRVLFSAAAADPFAAASTLRHPQLFTAPLFRRVLTASVSRPQSHRQRQSTHPPRRWSVFPMTVSRPKRWPAMSFTGISHTFPLISRKTA